MDPRTVVPSQDSKNPMHIKTHCTSDSKQEAQKEDWMIKPSKPMLTDTIQNSIKNVLISIGASTTVYLFANHWVSTRTVFDQCVSAKSGFGTIISSTHHHHLQCATATPSSFQIFSDWQKEKPPRLSSICKSRNKQNIYKKKLQTCSFACGGGPLKLTR